MKYCFLGAGGHARSLVDALFHMKINVDYIVGSDTADFFKRVFKSEILESDIAVLNLDNKKVRLINAIGPRASCSKRQSLNDFFERYDFKFKTIIAHTAIISPFSEIEIGCQIMHAAIINNSVKIGKHSVINTGAIVEHDVSVGANSFIGPNVTVCGGVNIQSNVFIGAGAIIFPGVTIKRNAVISGGAVVNRNIQENEVVK